jgi:hypothetical protein
MTLSVFCSCARIAELYNATAPKKAAHLSINSDLLRKTQARPAKHTTLILSISKAAF